MHRVANLTMYQPLPTHDLQQIDPFILLHHHGPHRFEPYNKGLPFGPHPHRGFETVTLIFEGNVVHHDSQGFKSTIREGGVQWMTAARGIVHSEQLDKEMQEHGGPLEIIQLWINLPSKLKMSRPNYQGFQKESIPVKTLDNGNVAVNIISGIFGGSNGPVQSITGIQLSTISMKAGGQFETEVDPGRNILLYVMDGEVTVNGTKLTSRTLAEFENDAAGIRIEAGKDSRIVFGNGEPYNEPIVTHGPFVMNTTTEIMQAMRDYQMGKMGILIEE
ncbi:MAG: nuclease PIN [Bacteroidetes bacterium]|nr:MAG: nuclease PIN [Bacteroidota bacterium]